LNRSLEPSFLGAYGSKKNGISHPILAANDCPSICGSGTHLSSFGGQAISLQMLIKPGSLAHTSAN